MGGPPWGRQTAWGHLDYERCIWLNERAGLSLPVIVSFENVTASTWVCFSTSLLKALGWRYQILIHFFSVCFSQREAVHGYSLSFPSLSTGEIKVNVRPDWVLQGKSLSCSIETGNLNHLDNLKSVSLIVLVNYQESRL